MMNDDLSAREALSDIPDTFLFGHLFKGLAAPPGA